MTVYLNLGDLDMFAVSAPDQLLCGLATRLDDFFRIAAQKNLSDCLLIVGRLRIWEMPG